MDLSRFLEGDIARHVASSILVIVIVLVLRTATTRVVLHHVAQSELRRRWIVNIRNSAYFILALSLAAIWSNAIRTFAAAIAVAAVAFVIATKEFILCISGSILRAATNAYSIGDRVEIGSHRGDVIDLNIFTTTILEVGPGRTFHQRTGRAIVIPNSKLLDTAVINESFMKKYVVHVFTVPLKVENDWRRAAEILLESANAECAPFLEEAKSYMEQLERQHSLESLPTRPRVAVDLPEPGRIYLLLRFPAPVGRRGRLEQAILRRFLEKFYAPTDSGPAKLVEEAPEQGGEAPSQTEDRSTNQGSAR